MKLTEPSLSGKIETCELERVNSTKKDFVKSLNDLFRERQIDSMITR